MDRIELQGRIQGIPATVPTPFDDKYRLDLAKMTDLTRWWIKGGLGTDSAPLKVAAAMGEGPDLSDDEWPHLLKTVVGAAGNDATIMCALKPKNTLHTIEDAKRAQDLGAIGLQIDLPFFHHPNQDDIVRFFTDISDAIDIGIMIYNTFWFGFDDMSLQADTALRLANAEHVVAIKWNVPPDQNYDDMRKFSHIFNVIDNSGQTVRCHRNGGRGFISGMAAIHPPHPLKVWDLLEQKKYDEAQAEIDQVKNAMGPWGKRYSGYSGGYWQIKAYMAAMGRPVGPPRLPTLAPTEEMIQDARGIFTDIGWPVV